MLPVKNNIPSLELTDYTWMFYGEPGCGKTTLACQFPNVLHLVCGENPKHIESKQIIIDSWKDFKDVIAALSKEKHEFQTIVLDTLPDLYERCMIHVCKTLKIDHPSEGGHGKAWNAVLTEFSRTIKIDLKEQGYSIVAIAHEDTKEFKDEQNKPYLRVIPRMPGQCQTFTNSFINFLGRIRTKIKASSDIPDRILTFNSTQFFEAKAHLPIHMLKDFPKEFIINKNRDAIGYQLLCDAFNK